MNWVLELALRVTALLALGICLRWLIGRSSAERRVTILRTCIASLAVLPLAMILLPSVSIPILAPESQTLPTSANVAVELLDYTTPTPNPSTMQNTFAGTFNNSEASPASSASNLPNQALNWKVAAIWLWLCVSALLLSTTGIRLWQAARLRRSSQACITPVQEECEAALQRLRVRSAVDCRIADVRSPMTFGVVRHTILLPRDFHTWPDADRNAVLLHEAAHIQRFDCAWQWLASAVRAVYWCHPFVWFTSRALRDDSELAADERAVRSGIEATDYAASLIAIARNIQLQRGLVRPQGVTFMQKDQLERRVQNILRSRKRGFSSLGLLSLCAAMCSSAAMIGAMRFTTMKPDVVVAQSAPLAPMPGEVVEDIAPVLAVAPTVDELPRLSKIRDYTQELPVEEHAIATVELPTEWASDQSIDFNNLPKSVTPVQREIIESRGYLLPEDLTKDQKAMLGKLPENMDFSFSISLNGQVFALRARRPSRTSTGLPSMTRTYKWDPAKQAYIRQTAVETTPSPNVATTYVQGVAKLPKSANAAPSIATTSKSGATVFSGVAPVTTNPNSKATVATGPAVAAKTEYVTAVSPKAPTAVAGVSSATVPTVASPQTYVKGVVAPSSGSRYATTVAESTKIKPDYYYIHQGNPLGSGKGNWSVSLTKGTLVVCDPQGNVKEYKVPEGSSVTLTSNGVITVKGPDGKVIDLKIRSGK
ncbi:MAG: hypothetical protein KF784_07480 [Fimbriimonadaceae bacterium]|nr:hypothetical protein [Fimbriimonadaceae bacterium]